MLKKRRNLMHTITIEKRNDDIMAYIYNDKKRFGCGKTKYQAIADVICANQTELEIIIKDESNDNS